MLKFRSALAFALSLILVPSAALHAQPQAPAPSSARATGAVKSIDGTSLTVVTAAGATVTIPVAADATVLQIPPDSKDLKAATPAKMADIAVGDKVVVGKVGDTTTASRVILMKSGDIAARNAAEQADWQKRGSSGLVKSVSGATLTVTAGAKTVTVATTDKTIFRRYAADSVKFQDATPGTLAQIRAGDQLSVRGDKSADGATITAEEIVAGSFANLSGLLTAVDASAGTVTFKDLTTKKPVTVKLTANADIRKLPAQAAAMIAARNTPGAAAGAGGGAGLPPSGAQAGARGPGGPGGAGGGAGRAGMDLSRMLARLPTETVADLKAGDAVMVVASPSSSADSFTAITLLSGVDALLTAAPGAQPITLSPWTLGAPEGGGGAPQ